MDNDSTIHKQWKAAIILSSVFVPLSTLATILRFYVRIRDRKRLGAEDWCVLASLAFFYGYITVTMWSFQIIRGRSPAALSIPEILLTFKLSYAGVIFVSLCQGSAKFSLLLLYYRIFSIEQRYKFWIIGMMIANIIWFIAGVSLETFQCRPIRKVLNPFVPGSCLTSHNVGIAFGTIELWNGLLDFVMVAVAFIMVRKIQVSRRDRWKISIIFAIGGFVGVISIIKIIINANLGIYNEISLGIWDMPQLGFAVICCCAPIYRSVLPKTNPFSLAKSRYTSLIHGLRYGSASRTAKGDSTSPSSRTGGNWLHLDESREVRVVITTNEMPHRPWADSVKTVDVEQRVEMV